MDYDGPAPSPGRGDAVTARAWDTLEAASTEAMDAARATFMGSTTAGMIGFTGCTSTFSKIKSDYRGE